MRSSLSCARRRRLRCLPSPAASSISSRRSRGLDVTISATRPWETTECISLPSPVSLSSSSTSVSRQRAPLTRYSPSPARLSRRTIEISDSGRSTAESELSSTTSTSASARAWTPCAPAKITSCIDWPRTATGDCSPIAHSTASVTLDLPEPFGPTITETPGEKSSRVRSGNDLKPLSVIDLRCTSGLHVAPTSSAAAAAACSASFLERPEPRATVSPSTIAATSNVRSCGGPGLRRHLVEHERAAPRQPLLQRRLEVGRPLERLLDLRRERLAHRLRRRLEAVGQVARADHRLDHRGEHPLGRDAAPPAPAARRPAAPRPAAAPAARAARRPRGTSGPETACARIFVSRPAP